jgi:hypothetical protein
MSQGKLDIFEDKEQELIDSTYTKKVDVPIYTPSYQKPDVFGLVDNMKTQKLIKEINESSVGDDEKRFLIMAAHRHSKFFFSKIADYWHHSTPEMRKLMEKSALVIPDFDKAIEYGFVTLNAELAELYKKEQND